MQWVAWKIDSDVCIKGWLNVQREKSKSFTHISKHAEIWIIFTIVLHGVWDDESARGMPCVLCRYVTDVSFSRWPTDTDPQRVRMKEDVNDSAGSWWKNSVMSHNDFINCYVACETVTNPLIYKAFLFIRVTVTSRFSRGCSHFSVSSVVFLTMNKWTLIFEKLLFI